MENINCTGCSHRDICKFSDDFGLFVESIPRMDPKLAQIFKVAVTCNRYNEQSKRQDGPFFSHNK